MDEEKLARLHVRIEGYVQGVGFRNFVQETAYGLGLTGWVRNRWNGDVEVLAEGDRQALGKLLTALYRGPRGSSVMGIAPEWQEASGEFSRFQVRMTE